MRKATDQKNKRFGLNRLAALLCVSLLLPGCAGTSTGEAEEYKEAEEFPVSEQVIEVGILTDCGDPYAVVTYESFIKEASQASEAIVAELHDCRQGYEAQLEALAAVKKTGVDILLIDIIEDGVLDGEELEAAMGELEVPVLYFGAKNPEQTLGFTGSYIGLSEEETAEYEMILGEDRFEGSGYREKAEAAGKVLLEQALKLLEKD